MINNGLIKIFYKEWGVCNFFEIYLCVPYFRVSLGEILALNVFAPTDIGFENDGLGWEFNFRLLGFGINIVRQWSY